MNTQAMNGDNAISEDTENHSLATHSKKKGKKKLLKKQKKSDRHNQERHVFHHISEAEGSSELSNKDYEKELAHLQVELVKLQYWVKHTGTRIVILFEGRDAAGKGGTIKRIQNRSILGVVEL